MLAPPRSRWAEALEVARDLWRRTRLQARHTMGLAALSLLIGITLWIVVTDAENPTRIDTLPTSIPVEAVNVDESLAVANAQQLPSVEIRVSAPEDRWEELTADNFRAYVDLNGLEAREERVPVQIDVVGASRVRVIETIPSTVVVNLEDLVTKQVPVTTRTVGTLPRGYEPGEIVPERNTVEVAGPESLVSLVNEAVADVNMTGLTVGLEQSVRLVPAQSGGEIRGVTVRPNTINVSVEVLQSTLTRTLPLEAQITGQPAPGYRISGVRVTPSTVQVEGTIDVLQALDTLQLPPIDVTGQQTDLRTDVQLALPEGVAAPDTSSVTVEVTITPISGSLRLTLAPEVTNVRSGATARVNTGNVVVLLEGPLPRLNSLQPGAVRATVDLADIDVGTTDVRVNVTAPEGITVREVQPANVSVTVTRP
jgi:YbbR domain-containing protein